MNIIYYLEVNLICVIILSLFWRQVSKKQYKKAEMNCVLNWIIVAAILLCVCDMIAGVFRGAAFFGARTLIILSNWIYFEALAVISCLWAVYVLLRTSNDGSFRKIKYWLIVPLILYTIAAFTNGATGFLFVIDENNLYVRGSGVIVHWVVTWGYFLFATYQTIVAYSKEKNRSQKQEIKPLIYFFIAPLFAAVIQMLFYGVTSMQAGVTVSIAMICITTQNTNILTDPLTGLNNRRRMDNYLEQYLENRHEQPIMFQMIDINGFKKINDTFGHIVGDQVLIEVSKVLKQTCQKVEHHVFLCRYGGDEFLIADAFANQDDMQSLQQMISRAVRSSENNLPCAVSVSIGSAFGVCNTPEELKDVIDQADKAMYRAKYKRNYENSESPV